MRRPSDALTNIVRMAVISTLVVQVLSFLSSIWLYYKKDIHVVHIYVFSTSSVCFYSILALCSLAGAINFEHIVVNIAMANQKVMPLQFISLFQFVH